MDKFAFYGKGGIGKSVVATNLSACYGKKGNKVLHVGCDPKHDSSVKLLGTGRVKTVLDIIGQHQDSMSLEMLINKGKFNIHCIESGGPPPGVGCGGRGVARTIEFLDEMEIFDSDFYDIAVFDVLGDVVCGGFAAPLRSGIVEKVFIVVSEEPMALYAANNISKAIETYKDNGVVLGGLIGNIKASHEVELLERFASAINTSILTYIPRDILIQEAEKNNMTVVEYAPDSEITSKFVALSETVSQLKTDEIEPPAPMLDEDFFEFIKGD